MKSIKTLVLGASVLVTGFGGASVANQAHAATQGNSEYVKNVDIDFTGSTPVINIENKAANKHINALDLKVQGSKIDIGIDGYVECKDANNVTFMVANAYFGGVGIGGFGQLTTQGTLHDEKVDVAYKEKGGVAEATEDTFSVPLSKIKNGHPALRVDPLEELEKARQAFNGSDVDFYKQDQEIVLQRPVSLGAVCGKLNNTDKRSVGFETKNATIKIKYKGDPAVNDAPVLKAELANNVPNQVQQNPDLPFHLDKAEFMANIPHHIGKCVPDSNPKIRINFQTSGGKDGLMDLRVKAVSNQYADYGYYFDTQGIYKKAGENSFIDFSFPLKEMLSQNKYSYMAIADGKTYNHNMRVEVRYKNQQGGNWSQWKEMDTAVFKHRCTPQLNGLIQGGGNNGGVGGYDNGGQEGSPQINGTIKASPVEPAPRLKRAQ